MTRDRICNWVFGTSLALLVAGTAYMLAAAELLIWTMVHGS